MRAPLHTAGCLIVVAGAAMLARPDAAALRYPSDGEIVRALREQVGEIYDGTPAECVADWYYFDPKATSVVRGWRLRLDVREIRDLRELPELLDESREGPPRVIFETYMRVLPSPSRPALLRRLRVHAVPTTWLHWVAATYLPQPPLEPACAGGFVE